MINSYIATASVPTKKFCLFFYEVNVFLYLSPAAVVFYYAFWQLSICWIAHIGSMFWAVWFPFHALRYETTNRNKYIHFTVVLLALILPGIPAGVHFAADGFVFGRFPPITCIGRNSKANFYSIIFPAALADVVALSLLILIFWIVYKVILIYHVP